MTVDEWEALGDRLTERADEIEKMERDISQQRAELGEEIREWLRADPDGDGPEILSVIEKAIEAEV